MKEDKVRYLIEKEQVISDINIFRDVIKKDKYYDDKILYSPESLKLLKIFGIENMNYYETAHCIFSYYESRFDKFCKSYKSPNYGNQKYNAIKLIRHGIGASLNDLGFMTNYKNDFGKEDVNSYLFFRDEGAKEIYFEIEIDSIPDKSNLYYYTRENLIGARMFPAY